MKTIIKLLGLLFLALGISILIKPEFWFSFLENNKGNPLFYLSAIFGRLAFKESKYPDLINIIGFIAILAAFIFSGIFIVNGRESFLDIMSMMISTVQPFARVSSLISIGIGGLLIYAFWGSHSESKNNRGR